MHTQYTFSLNPWVFFYPSTKKQNKNIDNDKGKRQATLHRKLDTIPCFNTFTVPPLVVTASEERGGGGVEGARMWELLYTVIRFVSISAKFDIYTPWF
jgi:hypothetical protein